MLLLKNHIVREVVCFPIACHILFLMNLKSRLKCPFLQKIRNRIESLTNKKTLELFGGQSKKLVVKQKIFNFSKLS